MLGEGDSFLRQLSVGKDGWNSSKRWSNKGPERSLHQQMEGLNLSTDNVLALRKRLMVVVDHSTRAKHAMMWALTHVANKGDLLTLLHIIPPQKAQSRPYPASSPHLAHSLGSLCKACKPEVEVEALVIHGHRLPTVLSQVKKLEASVLVLGQKKPTPVNWVQIMKDLMAYLVDCWAIPQKSGFSTVEQDNGSKEKGQIPEGKTSLWTQNFCT